MQTKVCTDCGIEKPVDKFYPHKAYRFDVKSVCKICDRKGRKKRRKNNLKAERERYKKNPEKVKKATRRWQKENPEKTKTIRKKADAKRRGTLKGKLNNNISRAINTSLKGNKNGRHWENIVGYALDDLKNHLEGQFRDGMSWENYGKWHIDHKIPISVFNFKKPEHRDFKRCWTLSNLQPLWGNENISKYNKLTKHFQPSLLM